MSVFLLLAFLFLFLFFSFATHLGITRVNYLTISLDLPGGLHGRCIIMDPDFSLTQNLLVTNSSAIKSRNVHNSFLPHNCGQSLGRCTCCMLMIAMVVFSLDNAASQTSTPSSALIIFLPPPLQCFLSLRGIDVNALLGLTAQLSLIFSIMGSQKSSHSLISCNERLFWLKLRVVFVCRYKRRYSEGSLRLCQFS